MKKRKQIESAIKRLILPLNNALPDNLQHFWVTAEEIHERLIHAGVAPSLTLSLVQEALLRNNKGETFVKRWEYGGVNYYRSTIANIHCNEHIDVPSDQRFKGKKSTGYGNRININPQRDYFKNNDNKHFAALSKSLDDLESK